MADSYVTLEEARTRSPLLTRHYASPVADETLEQLLADATLLVGALTCRALVEGAEGEAVPDHLVDLAKRAVVLKAEQMHVRGGTARSRTAAINAGRLSGFSAGPYSESYFSPEVAAKAKMLDPDPALHEVLWALASSDCRYAWLELWADVPAPAAGAVAYDYGARPGGYGGAAGLPYGY